MAEQYEFSASENETIKLTASRASGWGKISTAIGALQILGALISGGGAAALATGAVGGIVSIVVGVTFIGVGKSLNDVVDTSGNDVGLMMAAMQKLTTAFTIQTVVTVGGFILAFVGAFIIGMVAGMSK